MQSMFQNKIYYGCWVFQTMWVMPNSFFLINLISPPACSKFWASSIVFSKWGTTLSLSPYTWMTGILAFATLTQVWIGIPLKSKTDFRSRLYAFKQASQSFLLPTPSNNPPGQLLMSQTGRPHKYRPLYLYFERPNYRVSNHLC